MLGIFINGNQQFGIPAVIRITDSIQTVPSINQVLLIILYMIYAEKVGLPLYRWCVDVTLNLSVLSLTQ